MRIKMSNNIDNSTSPKEINIKRMVSQSSHIETIKKFIPSIITFFVMNFIYFPLLTSCLLINYMIKNGFFSYEIISKNFIAISISTSLMVIMLGILSLSMWSVIGYRILISKKLIIYDNKSYALLFGLNILFIILMVFSALLSETKILFLIIALLSLGLMIFYCFYFTTKIKTRLIMISCLTGITVFCIFVYGETSSLLFGKALNTFGIGGNSTINIKFKEKSYESHKGILVLLTPDFVYYKKESNIIIAPMNNIKTITIDKTH